MTADQVAAASAIAGLVTAIAALLTILELRRQRLDQQRPELVVEDTAFTVFRTGQNDDRPLIAVEPAGSPPTDSSDWRARFPLSVANVGRGVARDVVLVWSFDALAFAERLAPFEHSIGGRVWVNGDLVEISADEEMISMMRKGFETRLGALLPVPDGAARIVHLDVAYGRLLALYYAAVCDPRNTLSFTDWSVPPICLEMRYRDVGGRAYVKRLIANPNLEMLAPHGFGNKEGEWYSVGQGIFVVTDA